MMIKTAITIFGDSTYVAKAKVTANEHEQYQAACVEEVDVQTWYVETAVMGEIQLICTQ
jgi:hypothetical protein